MSRTKKIIIIVACGIGLFCAGLCTGRFIRLGILESGSRKLDDTIIELEHRIASLDSELSERIRDVEQLESNIDEAGRIADELYGDIRQLREMDSTTGAGLSDARVYVQELRKRIQLYEERIEQLETEVSRLKSCLSK